MMKRWPIAVRAGNGSESLFETLDATRRCWSSGQSPCTHPSSSAKPVVVCCKVIVLVFTMITILRHHIQVVLFQEAQVLSGFGKLALLHSMIDIVMYIRSLRVHLVIFRVIRRELSHDSNIVAQHHHTVP